MVGELKKIPFSFVFLGAHVRKVNFGHLTQGVLHTKLWIVDMKHIYIGSANMDWRSLTQVNSACPNEVQ